MTPWPGQLNRWAPVVLNSVNTLTFLIWIIGAGLAILHIVSLLQDDLWQSLVAFVVYCVLCGVSLGFSFMILSDIYPGATPDMHWLQFFLVMGLAFLATSSIYRLRRKRTFSIPKPPRMFGVTNVFLEPIASVIQLVASVLGIISFYLQFIRAR